MNENVVDLEAEMSLIGDIDLNQAKKQKFELKD